MATVKLTSVGKIYDKKVRATNDFNLDIGDGEFVVFVGPSGCGKSTTLRMIAGLEEISEGIIEIGERVVNDVLPKDRDIAMVFQNYALYPHMSVYKNMAFGLMLRKVPRTEIKERVNAAAKMLGIEDLLERKPKQLSGGQRQRVALGRAIVREPAVFLFDEPLSNLDAKLRVTTRTEIKALHQRLTTTTIYVTHDQEEAMTLGDRIVVMSAARGVGTIEQVDTPLNVYRYPANRFVGAFLGRTPMNFLEGRLIKQDDAYYFVREESKVSIRMNHEFNDRLSPYEDRSMTLGWRPDAMSETNTGIYQGHDNHLTLNTLVVEPLGREIDVSCQTDDGIRLIARIDARDDFPEGKAVQFFIDTEHVHLFEPGEFGINVIHPDGQVISNHIEDPRPQAVPA
ncbi:MAG: sn-glycerol-3-phosphate ABC transporter ATP-binding protein UgpC [Planctomycetota bacterium]